MEAVRRRGGAAPSSTRSVPRAGVYFPGVDGRGGAERQALVLALELARAGWETTLFTDVPVDQDAVARDHGTDVTDVRFVALGRARDGGRLRELRRLATTRARAAAIRRHDLDLFVNAKYKSELPGCGRRNVYLCLFPHRDRDAGGSAARRAYLAVAGFLERRFVLGTAGGFLATYDDLWSISRFTAEHVRSRWGRDSRVLHPPCEGVAPGTKERVIAVVGRFQAPAPAAPYKAQDVLLGVFAGLTDLHAQGWRLVLAGGTTPADATYLADLRAAADGLPVDVVENGSRADIEDLLGRASLYWHAQGFGQDVRTHPETQEHFGISTVEAMSAGAVPVVIGTAGPAEVVEGVEGVATWTDLDTLAALTRDLAAASEDELAPLRARCRTRAADFAPDRFRRRLLELL